MRVWQEDNGYDEEALDKAQATEQPTQEDLDAIADSSEDGSESSVHDSDYNEDADSDDMEVVEEANINITEGTRSRQRTDRFRVDHN